MQWFSVPLFVLILMASGCGGSVSTASTTFSPSTLKVDSSVKPAIASIPDPHGGAPLPVAGLKQAGDSQIASFVEGRVIVSTSSNTDLQAFLTRWGGTVTDTLDMQQAGLGQVPNLYLVKIDPGKASPAALPQDLQKINAKQRADLLVSSDTGSRTLAAAIHEAATTHLTVGLDWLALPATEAPTGNGRLGGVYAYGTNVVNWPYMMRGGPQDIGVVAAWGLLGPTSPHIKIAILDGGFCGTPDLPADTRFFPASPTCERNPWADGTGGVTPYHGAETAETAFGIANNGRGAAGVAGAVAQPLLVRSPDPDLYAIIRYLTSTLPTALASGVRILNISAALAVPGPVSFLADPVGTFFGNLRAHGVLTFAAAGNAGVDLNERQCIIWCWQKNVWVPCQFSGVICVGGLAVNSTRHASGSNFSSRGDIAIYAPFDVWTLGATDNDVRTDAAHATQGTSFSSPFVAGVAALIWSMNPSLSADDVQRILLTTAHTGSPDPVVPRWVNAYAAVVAAQRAPQVTILSPANGAHFYVGQSAYLQVRAVEPVSGRTLPGSAIRWTVNGTALPDHLSSLTYPLSRAGTFTIGASATNEGGATAHATPVTITVVNPPPATIIAPTEGQIIYAGSDLTALVTFQAGNTAGWTLTWRDVSHGSPGIVLGTGARIQVRLRMTTCTAHDYTVDLVATNGSTTVTRTVHFTFECFG